MGTQLGRICQPSTRNEYKRGKQKNESTVANKITQIQTIPIINTENKASSTANPSQQFEANDLEIANTTNKIAIKKYHPSIGLKTFKISVDSLCPSTKTDAERWITLKDPKSLLKFYFDFISRSKNNDEDVQDWALDLRQLKSLSVSDLEISYCTDIQNTNIKHFYQNSLTYMSSLSILKLSFSYINDKAVDILAFALKYLKRLSVLELEFYGRRDNNTVIESLSKVLKYLGCLSTFVLAFSGGGRINDREIKRLFSSLRYLGSLKTLSLILSIDRNREVQRFTSDLYHLKSLTSLSLNFSCSENIKDKAIKSLSLNLGQLSSLSKLDLDFRICNNIGNKGIKSLCLALANLRLLTSLILIFPNCFEIDENGLCYFTAALKPLNLLATVKLCFTESKINDKGLEYISKGLKDLTFLSLLYLDFAKGIGTMYQSFKHLVAVDSFFLHFTVPEQEKYYIDNNGLLNLEMSS